MEDSQLLKKKVRMVFAAAFVGAVLSICCNIFVEWSARAWTFDVAVLLSVPAIYATHILGESPFINPYSVNATLCAVLFAILTFVCQFSRGKTK